MNLKDIIQKSPVAADLSDDVSGYLRPIILTSALSDRVKAHAITGTLQITTVGPKKTRMLTIVDPPLSIPLPIGKLRGKTKPPPTNRAKVSQCCRDLIIEQIAAFRREFWPNNLSPICPLSGRRLTPQASHVDHVYPFIKLVEDWARINQVDIETVTVKLSRKLGRLTMGDKLDSSWREYHFRYAKLQMLSPKANLQKGAKLNG